MLNLCQMVYVESKCMISQLQPETKSDLFGVLPVKTQASNENADVHSAFNAMLGAMLEQGDFDLGQIAPMELKDWVAGLVESDVSTGLAGFQFDPTASEDFAMQFSQWMAGQGLVLKPSSAKVLESLLESPAAILRDESLLALDEVNLAQSDLTANDFRLNGQSDSEAAFATSPTLGLNGVTEKNPILQALSAETLEADALESVLMDDDQKPLISPALRNNSPNPSAKVGGENPALEELEAVANPFVVDDYNHPLEKQSGVSNLNTGVSASAKMDDLISDSVAVTTKLSEAGLGSDAVSAKMDDLVSDSVAVTTKLSEASLDSVAVTTKLSEAGLGSVAVTTKLSEASLGSVIQLEQEALNSSGLSITTPVLPSSQVMDVKMDSDLNPLAPSDVLNQEVNATASSEGSVLGAIGLVEGRDEWVVRPLNLTLGTAVEPQSTAETTESVQGLNVLTESDWIARQANLQQNEGLKQNNAALQANQGYNLANNFTVRQREALERAGITSAMASANAETASGSELTSAVNGLGLEGVFEKTFAEQTSSSGLQTMFGGALVEKEKLALQQQMNLLAEEQKADEVEEQIELDASGTSSERKSTPTALASIAYPLRHPQWAPAVGKRIIFMANQSIQQAQISLNPEKLGPIQLRLQVDQDQMLSVSMTASHLTTRETLEAALPKLKEMLESAGIVFDRLLVEDEDSFHRSSQQSFVMNRGAANDSEIPQERVAELKVQQQGLIDYYA